MKEYGILLGLNSFIQRRRKKLYILYIIIYVAFFENFSWNRVSSRKKWTMNKQNRLFREMKKLSFSKNEHTKKLNELLPILIWRKHEDNNPTVKVQFFKVFQIFRRTWTGLRSTMEKSTHGKWESLSLLI